MDAFSLDQFATFVAIVDEGSFVAAARRSGRAQSAITYAIQKLEEQSGAILFDRSTYRPTLTRAGRSLLPYARRVLADLAQFRAQAKALASGIEAEVRLVVPEAIPADRLTAALWTLRGLYPSVRLRVTTEPPDVALAHLRTNRADVAVLLDMIDLPSWFRRSPCARTRLIAVASPHHPLAAQHAAIASEVLADHLQIVVTGRWGQDGGADHGVVAVNRWDVTDYGTKRLLLLAGLGWGSMPEEIVAPDIAAGRLVQLTPARWDGAASPPELPFVVGIHADRPSGPATRALMDALARVPTE